MLFVNVSFKATYLGRYSSDTSIDVSNLGATSASQFVAVPRVNFHQSVATCQNDSFFDFYSPSFNLNGNTLTFHNGYINAGYVEIYVNTTRQLTCDIYFIGT